MNNASAAKVSSKIWRARILIAAILILAGIGTSSCKRSESMANGAVAPAGPATLEVKVLKAALAEWDVTVAFSGSLRSKSVVDAKTEVGGRLIATHFEEGDIVARGQLLAEIDSTNYRLAYDQAVAALGVAQAGLVRAQVALEHAKREKERADNLLRTGGVTEKDHQAAATGVKDAESQVGLADAQVRQAKAAIALTEKAVKDCRVPAPAAGQVSKKYYDAGTFLAPGSPLYTLVDNSNLRVECLIPANELSELRLGQRATFTTPTYGTRQFAGFVSSINPMVESDNRTVRVEVNVANPKGELRSGMYARGAVNIRREPKAVVIPRSALVSEQETSNAGKIFVFKDGTASRQDIVIGGIQKDRLWVQKGLQEGARVIIEIGPMLKDGAAVRIASNSNGAPR